MEGIEAARRGEGIGGDGQKRREKAEEKHREHGSSAAEPGREFEADAPLLTSYPDRCR